jgi:glycosyltransferase 2 family protein
LPTNPPGLSKGKRRTLIVIGLTLACTYVVVALLTDAAQLNDALRQLGWLGCGGVLALSAANYLFRFLRWQHYLTRLGHRLPWARHLLIYLSGFAFTVSPAKAGEAVRSLYLRDLGVTYTTSMAAFFVERLLDMFAIVLLAGLIVFDHPRYRVLMAVTTLLLVGVFICVCQPSLPHWLERIGSRSTGRIGRLLVAGANLLRSSRTLLHPQPLLTGLVAGLLAWGAEGIGFAVVCQGLHIDGGLWTFCGIYAVAVLGGLAAFFLPAGIGGMEVVMTTLLVERGATLQVAIIATLLCRLATLWFAVLIGVGAASAVEVSHQPLPARVVQ